MPGSQQSHSITPHPQLDRGEKNTTDGSWIEIGTGSDHSLVTIMGKPDSTWGN